MEIILIKIIGNPEEVNKLDMERFTKNSNVYLPETTETKKGSELEDYIDRIVYTPIIYNGLPIVAKEKLLKVWFRSEYVEKLQTIDEEKKKNLTIYVPRLKGNKLLFFPGEKYGLLVPINYDEEIGHWECICDCGQAVYLSSHRIGKIQSCGCLKLSRVRNIVKNEEWYVKYKKVEGNER
jgi:hypothetical protein